MTTRQLQTFCQIASNELLREIVASNSRKWAWHRFHAKAELTRRA